MARTQQAERLTTGYRQQAMAMRASTMRDLLRLWPGLDWNRIEASYPAWYGSVAALVQRDRRTMAGLAIRYLRDFRLAEGIPGAPPLVLATPLHVEQLATSLRVTSVIAFKRGVGAGQKVERAAANAFVQSSGAVTRHVLDGGRQTVMNTVRADPRARGWARVVSGNGCEFCQMLGGRGAVYTEETADFASHDHCNCAAEPAY